MTRRFFLHGSAAAGAVVLGSAAHQTILWDAQAAPTPKPALLPIPIFDLRGTDPASHAASRRDRVRALADACMGPLTPLARAAVAGADGIARRWLAASGTPYVAELARISRDTGVGAVHLLNASYEWGCTALAAPAPDGTSARLLRTLDWPFHGLGRLVELWRQEGPAGEFVHLSWPGAVGLLTGLAPGRFAASINQAPLRRRPGSESIGLDILSATYGTWRSSDRIPALHLLRRVFETARDYPEARAMLESTPIAAPTIYTLVGVEAGQTCVIERDVAAFHTREGVASAANAWRYSRFAGEWHGARASEAGRDSEDRSAMIESWAARAGEPFSWVAAPVLNGMTRLAVEMDPARGTLEAQGYEEAPGDGDLALPATLPLRWSRAAVG